MSLHQIQRPRQADSHELLTQALLRTALSDRDAFHDLYRLTSAKLFGICLTICRDHGVAQDVLQDVYLRVWTRAETFNPSRGTAIAWLAMIARNRSIDWIRSQHDRICRAETEIDLDRIRDESPLALDSLIASSDRETMLGCLADLDGRQRCAITDAFFAGMTYQEIARRDGIPLGTVKTWIRRGMMQIRTRLQSPPRTAPLTVVSRP